MLDEYGVTPVTTRRIKRGRNVHWVVTTTSDPVVLRKYAAECTSAEVDYEIQVLLHLAGQEWPVPIPLAAPVSRPDGIWCLFSYLPGRSPAPRSRASVVAEQQRRGRLLARLHADTAPLAALGQRPGWLRTDEGLFDRAALRPFEDVFRKHEQRDPQAARLLLEYKSEPTSGSPS